MRILPDPEKAEVVYGPENIIRREAAAFPDVARKMDGCYDYSGPSALVTTEPIWNATKDLARRGIRVRFITDITNENISYCKQLLEYVELRHLNGDKGNFGIADGIDCVIHSVLQEEQTPIQAIFTNVKSFVEAQQYLFDTLWSRAIPAEQRFREIEEGIKPDFIETIRDPVEIQKIGFDLIRSAKQEILILFSTINSFKRQERAGLIESLIDTVSKNDITIRILTHLSNETRRIADSLKTNQKFEVKFLQRSLQSRLTTMVIDRKLSLEVEVKDDTKDNSYDAVGFATYSNSESTVWTHASIFETLWMRSA